MRTILLTITCVLAGGRIAPLHAQTAREPAHFGVQINFGDDSKVGIGARVRYGLHGLFPNAPVSSIASADIYFPGHSVTWLDLNYNVVYNFRPASAPKLTPYAGGGLNFAYASGSGTSDSQLGLNILGGTEFRSTGRVTPFLELRIIIGGADQLVLTGGIKF